MLKYVMQNTGKKSGGKKYLKEMPVVEKWNVEDVNEELEGGECAAPILFLFFNKNKFDIAEVTANNCTIHLGVESVVGALLGYLAVYYVFHVGYAPEHENFLNFLQYAFLREKAVRLNVATTKLITNLTKQ